MECDAHGLADINFALYIGQFRQIANIREHAKYYQFIFKMSQKLEARQHDINYKLKHNNLQVPMSSVGFAYRH